MDTFALDNFSAEEQQTFLDSFQSYLRYDADRDFVVDLEKVYRIVGFAQKGHAKRLLVKYLKLNTDYTISPCAADTRGGHNREIIMLTPAAFRYFSMVASTSKSRDICKYYLKLEAMAFKKVDHALQQLNGDVANASAKIAELERQINNRKRRTMNYSSGSTIYIVRETPTLFKVGSSDDMTSRAKKYYTHSNQSIIVYTRRCQDCRFVERAIHKRFSKNRYEDREDWFVVAFETLRKGVEEVIECLEGDLSPEYTLHESLQNAEAVGVAEDDQAAADKKNDDPDADATPDDETEGDAEEEVPSTAKDLIDDATFDRFLEECYDVVEGHSVKWVEMSARYRLWARCTKKYRDAIAKHMMDRGYRQTRTSEDRELVKALAYVGLRPKPLLPFTASPESTSTERFMSECCIRTVTGGTPMKHLREAYVKWKRAASDAASYELTSDDSKELSLYCRKEFVQSVIYDGGKMAYGFYGVSLKDRADHERTSSTSSRGRSTKVQQLHPDTQEIIREHDSLIDAAKAIGCSPSAMCMGIKHQKIINGFRFRKAEAPQQPTA